MIENTLLNIIYILFYAFIGVTIVAIALMITLVIVLSESK